MAIVYQKGWNIFSRKVVSARYVTGEKEVAAALHSANTGVVSLANYNDCTELVFAPSLRLTPGTSISVRQPLGSTRPSASFCFSQGGKVPSIAINLNPQNPDVKVGKDRFMFRATT